METKQTYVAYYRVSTSSERQSLSFGFQQTSVEKFLEIYGGEVIAEFKEEISGTSKTRELFQIVKIIPKLIKSD